MNKFILLLGVGLVAVQAAELGLEGLKPSELNEIRKEIAAGNVPPNYTAEKPKRGVAKLTNTDSPNFNHLGSVNGKQQYNQATYSVQPSYSSAQAAYSQAQAQVQAQAAYNPAQVQQSYNPAQAQAQTAYNPAHTQAAYNPAAVQQSYNSPLRYLYGNQYFPANQYLSYLQNPQIASQLAQYSYQPQGVPHYLQTPTQIQYVSPPNYQQVPSAQFKQLTSKAPAATATATSSAQAQGETPSQATSQVLLHSNMAAYQQPQYVMYLINPHQQQALLAQQQQALLAQQHQGLLYPGQQMLILGGQNPLLSLYGNQHRFSLPAYSAAANGQLTYLSAAAAQQQLPQQQYQTLPSSVQQSPAENSQKAINVQESASSNSFGLRTKA